MRVSLSYESNLELTMCLSLITAKPLELKDINVSTGGLSGPQMSLIELVNKICNGASFEVNETGCRLRVIPGTLVGGEVAHDCHEGASLGYYAMYLVLLAPFCQRPLEATLRGITNCPGALSLEYLSAALADTFKEILGAASMFEIETQRRGASPNGGGAAVFRARPAQALRPLDRVDLGKIQKIRGVSWSTRVNPTIGKRQIDGAKRHLAGLLSDIYILTDHRKGVESGACPGHGLVLNATSTGGACWAAEVASSATGIEGETPEKAGEACAAALGREMTRGGVVPSPVEPILLAALALSRRDASRVTLGVPSPATIQALRDIKNLTGVRFSIEPIGPGAPGYRGDASEQQLLFSCVGCGIVNLNRAIR